ncbi:hypothetical protein ACHHYP_01744 [Achlya hypogyna]|uniref:Homologous recombination OB-fold protein OB-fold domain-containing protein n=1 Tax=Achlya hypogyna TaxID=1202772 RepID=A0A1V9ZT40_ACHHY|nr:hypothetical protein ACHHYP_01744 [Achlya hypogyna]
MTCVGTPMRKINGPLSDLWRKRHQNMQHDNGGVHTMQLLENTDFEHGPWIEMCQYAGLDAKEGHINGGIDLSRLPINTEQIAMGFQSSGVVEQNLLLLIQTSKYIEEEIIATFHDPLGTIEGYFHRDVVNAIGVALVKDTGIILRNVTVFMPVERRQQFLNICSGNIVRIFPATNAHEDEVAAFHRDVGDPFDVLEDSSLATTTSADLMLMTQRQVIQRASHAPLPEAAKKGKPRGKWAWKNFAPRKKAAKASPAPSGSSEGESPVVAAPLPPPRTTWAPAKRVLPMASPPPALAPPDAGGTQYESGIEMTVPSEDELPSVVAKPRLTVSFTQASATDLLDEALEDDW